MDGGAWKAAVHGVAEGQTPLSDFTFTFHFHALEKEMATHSRVPAWRIPGRGEPGGLPSMSQTWLKRLSSSSNKDTWKRRWQPTPVFLPGKFHGQRTMAGYSQWGHQESVTTEHISNRYKFTLNSVYWTASHWHIRWFYLIFSVSMCHNLPTYWYFFLPIITTDHIYQWHSQLLCGLHSM